MDIPRRDDNEAQGARPASVGWFVLMPSLLTVLAASPAQAHGIAPGAAELTTTGFLWLGAQHMLLGWDHLLFIAGVLLIARTPLLAAKLITLFVVGHSTTLILAVLGGWRFNASLVDLVIALSVVFVGVILFLGRTPSTLWFGAAVTGFGLVHGLGLATRFLGLGLPDEGLIAKVVAFNIGIECGQIAAITAMFLLARLLRGSIGSWWASDGLRIAAGGMAAAGVLASLILGLATLQTLGDPPYADLPTASGCRIRTPTVPLNEVGGTHPERGWFGPGESSPIEDFGHILTDGYVVLLYPPDLPSEDVDAIEEFATGPDGGGVLAGPAADGEERITVLQRRDTLVCSSFEAQSVTVFARSWLDHLGIRAD